MFISNYNGFSYNTCFYVFAQIISCEEQGDNHFSFNMFSDFYSFLQNISCVAKNESLLLCSAASCWMENSVDKYLEVVIIVISFAVICLKEKKYQTPKLLVSQEHLLINPVHRVCWTVLCLFSIACTRIVSRLFF